MLHDYQVAAVKHLHEHDRAGLFLEMGLGKTRVVLEALTPDHLPAIVIAPKRVVETVWKQERDKWGYELSMAIASGSPTVRRNALESGADVVVISRDNVKDIPKGRFRTFVIDELSSFKSRGVRWKIMKKITESARYVWGLTGTPAPNGMMDLWPQVYLLDRGERLGKYITHYRNRYFFAGRQLRSGVVIEWILKPDADERILEKIEDICLSMRAKDHLDLPAVTVNSVTVPLPPPVMKLYHRFKRDLSVDFELLGDNTFSAANAAVLTSKLSQVASGFLYADAIWEENENGTVFQANAGELVRLHEEKVNAIQEIVEGTGSPVLVFYQYKAERDGLLKALPEAKLIDEVPQADWDAGRVPIMMAHPQSASHGLNLQHGGHTVIWASLTWSLEEYQQGNGRVARQGQEHPVVIHQLISPGTIDEAKERRLETKCSVQDAVMDHLKGTTSRSK